MKNKLKYTFLLPLLAFAACSNEDDALPAAAQPQPGTTLEITVRAGDFAEDGAPGTRATDSGATTTFENGDRIGIIILDASNRILADNIPYRYNNGAWSFDSGNGESKNRCYYHKNATSYIAYFPYSPAADGVSTTDGLKNKFEPLSDQRTEDAYRASDLLTASGTLESKTLSVTLTHAYASVSLALEPRYLLEDGNNTECILSSLISDVNLTIGDDVYIAAYRAEDGSYRCILPADFTSGDIRYFYTTGSKTYGNTINISGAVAANTRYTFSPEKIRDYTLADAKVGDFYCKRSDNNEGYLIPGDVALTDGQKKACIGIVMKVGKDNSDDWRDDCEYKLKNSNTGMTTIYGYVLALYDANDGDICQWGSYGTSVGTNTDQTTGFYGYKNTQTIIDYDKNNGKNLQNNYPATYHATTGYESIYSAPNNSSGWFLPSAGQCQYWLNNKEALLLKVKNVTGNNSYNWLAWYWSSSESSYGPTYGAWCVYFSYGNVYNDSKSDSNYVRSCLAF